MAQATSWGPVWRPMNVLRLVVDTPRYINNEAIAPRTKTLLIRRTRVIQYHSLLDVSPCGDDTLSLP